MTQSIAIAAVAPARRDSQKPAPWLVAGGIVGAITLTLSCLVILAHGV